jgi:thiosulfate reductase/polysulfide reductase chain A
MKVPGVKTPDMPAIARKAPDAPKGQVFPFQDEGLAHGLRDASIPGTADFDIKGWFVYGTNLLQALPNPKRTIEAIQHLDFIVAVDVLPAEIVGYADVILPEATYLERWDDLAITPWKEPFVAVRQQVVPPMYDSKPGWWIAKELGKRLGLEAYFPWESAEAMVKQRLEAGHLDVASMLKTGVAGGKRAAVTTDEGATPVFDTPSGKVELYSQQMADAGLAPFPEYVAPPFPAADQFHLLFGRAPTHTFGRTTNNRELSEIMPENELWLNAKIAREQGLTADDRVVLVNQDGERCAPIRVKPTERIRPDCVYMVHGFGHTNPRLTFAKGRGADDSQLVTNVKIDAAMGGTGMNLNFVRIERAGETA